MMTLGQFIRNNTIQGNVAVSVWSDGDETDRIEVWETERLTVSAFKGLLSMPIKYLFCNAGQLVIEIEK